MNKRWLALGRSWLLRKLSNKGWATNSGERLRTSISSPDFLLHYSLTAVASSLQRLQSSSKPTREFRPSVESTQSREVNGGSCLTCCRWPHARIAHQWPASSLSNPTIFCFINSTLVAGVPERLSLRKSTPCLQSSTTRDHRLLQAGTGSPLLWAYANLMVQATQWCRPVCNRGWRYQLAREQKSFLRQNLPL